MIKVQAIKTDQEFENLRDEWNRLLSKSPTNNIFLTWEWLYTWWETYSFKKQLYMLLFKEDDGRIIGIAPFYTTYEKTLGVTMSALKLIGSEEVCSEYLDIIIQEDRINEVTQLMLSILQKKVEDLDIFFFKDIPENSLIGKVLLQLRQNNNVIYQDRIKTTNPFIFLPENENLFFNNLRNKGRHAIKDIVRREKKLTIEHRVSYLTVSENRDLKDSFNMFVTLHQKLWRSRGLPGMFKREKFLQFHQTITKRLTENGWLRIFTLFVDDRPVASLYGFQYKDKFYYYQSGFDPDWKVYGVGKIVLYHTIREAILNKLKEYDFLRGERDYKSDFTDAFRHTKEIFTARKTYKTDLYLLTKEMRKRSKRFLNRFFPKSIVSRARKIRDHVVLR